MPQLAVCVFLLRVFRFPKPVDRRTGHREALIHGPYILTIYLLAITDSQAVKAAGQVFVAGQIPADPSGNLIEGSIGEKTAQCCKNLKAILEASGSGIDRVVRVGVSLSLRTGISQLRFWIPRPPSDG